MTPDHLKHYTVELGGLIRHLPLIEVAPGVRIALLNILGDTELVQRCAAELVKVLPRDADALLTPEVKSIPLAHALSVAMGMPYIVVRKVLKPYMLDSIGEEVVSITTGKPQTLWLDGKDRALVKGKRIILVDDVISTGSTLQALRALVAKAGGEIVAEAAIFTEGDPGAWPGVIALGHLPVFVAKK
jgi:adenine phosphoribosyltransferase